MVSIGAPLELFDDGHTMTVPEVSLGEFPRFGIGLELLVKVGAWLVD